MIMGDVLSNLFAFLVVVAISFAALTLIASFVRFHNLSQRIRAAKPGDVDPEDLFQLRLVQELGALHQSAKPFSVMLLEPVVPAGFVEKNGEEAMERWMTAFADTLRGMVRDRDEVVRFKGYQCGVLGRFAHDRAEVVARRVSQDLARTSITIESGFAMRWPVHLGLASYPEHGERAAELLKQARAALDEARKHAAGHHHILPAPRTDEAGRRADPSARKKDPSTDSLLDELTGVLRAERLGTVLQKFLARHRKEGRAVSVLHISVDYFPQYRDHYSAQAADALIKGVADLLSDRTRETDVLARVAESDFAVAMDCAPAHALKAAQRLSSEAKKVPFRSGSTSLRITVSIGVAGYPDHSGQAMELLQFAESAMASARTRGRSVCLVYQPDMQPRQKAERPVDAF